jgi:uncharacterized membrane protein/glutaredoxin
MKRRLYRAGLIVGMLVWLAAPVWAAPPVVHAVLFYSPTCPHCHKVITEDLPPLFEKYGGQLQIIGVDVSQPQGQVLYEAAIRQFNIEQRGVPTLIVGDVVLIGSTEIPERFPALIEQHLAAGGVDWPDIPGLAEVLAAQATPAPADAAAPPLDSTTTNPGGNAVEQAWSKVLRDPIGNGLALIVLSGMLVSVGVVFVRQRAPFDPYRTRQRSKRRSRLMWREWLVPGLCGLGLTVAGYLAYIETLQVTAVCGPIGDCNTVQQSEYARLFGLLPIGVLGLIGYAAIGAAWWIERQGRVPFDRLAALALVAMTSGGTLFSIYLTFLEPFVIGATCLWCLTSAVLMTGLLWLIVTPQRLALIKGAAT